MAQIPSTALRAQDIPSPDASDIDVIRFAQSLNGYTEVGGETKALGAYVGNLKEKPVEDLSLNDLRILLFATQRAHYHQGGGWPDGDPLMDTMRRLTDLIRVSVPPE